MRGRSWGWDEGRLWMWGRPDDMRKFGDHFKQQCVMVWLCSILFLVKVYFKNHTNGIYFRVLFRGFSVRAVISLCYFCNWYMAHLFLITVKEPFSLIGPDTHRLSVKICCCNSMDSLGKAVIWSKSATLRNRASPPHWNNNSHYYIIATILLKSLPFIMEICKYYVQIERMV